MFILNKKDNSFLSITRIAFIYIAVFLFMEAGRQQAYKDSLRGNNPYTMEVLYKIDSIGNNIPADTIFIKTK